MKIKDSADFSTKPKPVTFSPDASVRAALDVMCEKNIGSIIATHEDGTIAGIVTERDMMIRVLGNNVNPDETRLAAIMSTGVRAANEDDDLVDWLRTMSNERFRHLPVVDNEGRLVNMISQGDLVAHTWPDLDDKIRQDLKDRLGRVLQILLVALTVVTLGLIAFNL